MSLGCVSGLYAIYYLSVTRRHGQPHNRSMCMILILATHVLACVPSASLVFVDSQFWFLDYSFCKASFWCLYLLALVFLHLGPLIFGALPLSVLHSHRRCIMRPGWSVGAIHSLLWKLLIGFLKPNQLWVPGYENIWILRVVGPTACAETSTNWAG